MPPCHSKTYLAVIMSTCIFENSTETTFTLHLLRVVSAYLPFKACPTVSYLKYEHSKPLFYQHDQNLTENPIVHKMPCAL